MTRKKVEHRIIFSTFLLTMDQGRSMYDWYCPCGVKGTTFYPEMRKLMGCPHDDKNLVNKRT